MRVLVCAILAASLTWAEEPKKELPKPLPENIVKAWTDAGATVSWMKPDSYSYAIFLAKAEAGTLPTFQFKEWEAGVIAKLPAPGTPFGLDFYDTLVTDRDLKELARFKNLSMLILIGTQVTDAGIKELAPLKKLTYLNMWGS